MSAARQLRPPARGLLANAALLSPPKLLRPALLATRTSHGELRSVSIPTLGLLAGRSVLLNDSAGQARLQMIPGVQAEVISKAGHGLALEQPDLINQRILRFPEIQASAS